MSRLSHRRRASGRPTRAQRGRDRRWLGGRRLPALGVAVALLLSATACDDPAEPGAAPSPTPSASPSPREVTLAEYKAMLTDLERAVRPGLERVVAARTIPEVDAARIDLVAIFEQRWKNLEAIRPPSQALKVHGDVWYLFSAWIPLRDTISSENIEKTSSCGVGIPSAEQLYAAKRDVYWTVKPRLDDELRAGLAGLGLTLDGMLPPEPKEPKQQSRRARNGEIVERNGARGPGSLRIENDGDFDAAVSVVVGKPSSPQATIYVRSDSTATLTGVTGSYYSVYVKTGIDWDRKRRGFTGGCTFEQFLKLFDGRSNWSISLRKTTDGNALTTDVPAY